jgi:2-phospho-L-lactate guanylyltransferase (CobY/MobA/RfbA family)
MFRDRPDQGPADHHPATFLVFTLGATAERARRRLLPSQLGPWELAIYRGCLDAALTAGRVNGCRLRVCTPRQLDLAEDVEQFPQEGRGFGARLRRAVARQRPSPTRPLVVVGSDAPGIEPAHVASALQRLRQRPDRLVVGPSPDGGFYLLAAARPVDELLTEVAWLGAATLASLKRAARARGIEISLLAPLADLDQAADLEGWLARREAPALPWLRSLLHTLRRLRRPPLRPVLGAPLSCRVVLAAGRGPPG